MLLPFIFWSTSLVLECLKCLSFLGVSIQPWYGSSEDAISILNIILLGIGDTG